MKKILFAAVAALAITSCSQSEDFDVQDQKAEIKVGTVVNKSTRAVDLINSNFTTFKLSSFVIDKNADITNTALGSPYMDGAEYTGGPSAWTTSGTYYWPNDKAVQFFGWYPESTSGLTVPATGYPSLSFSIGSSADSQKDIVVAALKSEKPQEGNNVTLAFRHILTKINFSYKPEAGYTYSDLAIKITGVKGGSATYKFTADNGTWESTETVEYSYATVSPEADNNNLGYYKFPDAASLMLMPQTLTADSKVVISYKVEKGSYTNTISRDIAISSVTSAWGIGQSIRYKLTLPAGTDKIGITTSDLPSWDAENSNDIL